MSALGKDEVIILRELQDDGRVSYAELSRITGIPGSTLHDKIKNMVARKIIKKYTVIVDDEKVGLNHIAIIGVETGAKLFKQVARELCEIHEVVEVYGTTAEFDLMIKARASSRDELSEILSTIRSIDGVDDIFVSSILEVFKEEHTLPLKDP